MFPSRVATALEYSQTCRGSGKQFHRAASKLFFL